MKIKHVLLLVSLLFVSACVRPAAAPLPTLDPTAFFEKFAQPGEATTFTPAVEEETEEAAEGEEITPTPKPKGNNKKKTATPFIITPTPANPITPTSVFTDTPEVPPTAAATSTPTDAPTPSQPPFDPLVEFKRVPTYVDDFESDENWLHRVTGKLPDTENLRLVLNEDVMEVTGKYPEYDTWWMAAPSFKDVYVEMQVNTGKCSGSDAYGLIVKGGSGDNGVRGFIIAFTCDGEFFVRRMDGTNPYSAEQIFIPTASSVIKRGSNQSNLIAVRFQGDVFMIYANGYPVNIYGTQDGTYEFGRYGIFVKAGPTENYTYSISQIRVWDLSK
ncbi:MAG: hypothetical protein OEY93_02355 [Anaerolineae bacterium]|nr:hypothetical protein [Anaerolineae bacterium]